MMYKIPNKLLRYGNFMALDYLILQILTITVYYQYCNRAINKKI